MVKLTSAQKKKLKIHATNQTATHMKKMIALMKDGASFNEAHKEASKPKQKQKQKQTQSQKVVVNLASPTRPQRRITKPRQSATPNSARVLSQFIQPQQAVPDSRTMINPAPIPMPFMNTTRPPQISNEFAPRPSGVIEGRILGRAPPNTPLEAAIDDPSPPYSPPLKSGRTEPDTPVTQGRKLVDDSDIRNYQNILAATRGYESGGEMRLSGATDTTLTASDDDLPPPSPMVRSSTGGTVPLMRVEEEDPFEGFGSFSPQGQGTPSPSLMRRY